MSRPLLLILALALALAPAAGVFAHGTHREDGDASAARASRPEPGPGTFSARPRGMAAPTRIYIANDDHTDYQWSAVDTTYRRVFQQMLDYYMMQAETTAYRPPDLRGRFNTDGTMWLWDYAHERTPAEFEHLLSHVRAGNITVPINFCIQLYGAMPAEAVLRSFAYAGHLARHEQLEFPLVVPMENQTLPGGVASLWAGCGVRYSWKGICDCATAINAGDRPISAYRFAGPDGQSVLMKWNDYYNNQSLGGYAEARNPYTAVNLMTTDPEFLSKWPYTVAGAFGYGWDDLETYTTVFLDAAASLSNANQRVIVSNERDFFEDFEATHGAELPTFSAGFGNEWDLLTAALAGPTSRVKRSVEKLRGAEALATVASLYDSEFMAPRIVRRDSAMIACGLYYEHSFSAGPGVTDAQRTAWQKKIEYTLTRYVDSLHVDGRTALGDLVQQPAGVERHAVFNPLGWSRTAVADLEATIPAPRRVIDVTSGSEVRSQSVVVNGQPRLRILASNVPSVGYKVYEVRAGAGAGFTNAATAVSNVIDNGTYAVTMSGSGRLTSVVDRKDANRQLVSPGAALNDIGAGAGTGSVVVESNGAVSATLRVSAGSPLARETRVTLYAGLDRIDIDNVIQQNFTSDVIYTSNFELPGMTMRHEEVGSIARVARLQNGGSYANENTRTDFLTFNHFVDLSQSTRGVTVSAWDAPFFRAGNSTINTLDGTTASIGAVVGIVPAGVEGALLNQGGESLFPSSYALRTHGAYDPAAAMRMALEHQNPMIATRVTGSDGSPLPASQWSLLTIDNPNVLLWALKPAEEGILNGIVARAWNLSDAPAAITLALPAYGIEAARSITHIETDLGPATLAGTTFTDNLLRQQMKSWRIWPTGFVSGAPVGGTARPRLAIYPNPLRAGRGSTIAYTLPRAGHTRLALHDLRGARVATLFDGERGAGAWEAHWNGQDAGGARVAPGVYFVRLETPGGVQTGRLVVLE